LFVFSPTDDANVGTSTFLKDRLKSGLKDMASFAALAASSPYNGSDRLKQPDALKIIRQAQSKL
jgi:hypothetical protein